MGPTRRSETESICMSCFATIRADHPALLRFFFFGADWFPGNFGPSASPSKKTAEKPLRCPACADYMVEPVEGVRLSVTINGVQSEVHGVSVYRCRQWHIFAL